MSSNSNHGALQLAKMMYGGIAEEIHVHNTPKFPIFSADSESFTRIMNEKIKYFKKHINRRKEEIVELQSEIDRCNDNIEFLLLNMTAFSPEIEKSERND